MLLRKCKPSVPKSVEAKVLKDLDESSRRPGGAPAMVATLPAGVLAPLTTRSAFRILWREVDEEERFGLSMAANDASRRRRTTARRGIFMVAKTVAFVVRAVSIFMSLKLRVGCGWWTVTFHPHD
jgi:hypothetical protein